MLGVHEAQVGFACEGLASALSQHLNRGLILWFYVPQLNNGSVNLENRPTDIMVTCLAF